MFHGKLDSRKEGGKLNVVYVTDLGAFRECLPTPVRPATNEPKGVSREQKDIQEPDSGKPGVSPGPVQHFRSGDDSLTGSRRSGLSQPVQDTLLFGSIPLSFKNVDDQFCGACALNWNPCS